MPNLPNKEETPYSQRDHSHCWNQKQPPACGIKTEHKLCCLCGIPNPSFSGKEEMMTEEQILKEFERSYLTTPEHRLLFIATGSTVTVKDIKSFLRTSLHRYAKGVLERTLKKIEAKESETIHTEVGGAWPAGYRHGIGDVLEIVTSEIDKLNEESK